MPEASAWPLFGTEKPGCGAKADGIYSNVWRRRPSLRQDRLGTCRFAGGVRTGPSDHRTSAGGTSRIQDPAHVLLPSGYEIRKNYEGADYVFYLPADTPSNARRFLDIVHPEIAIFIKYEFWINLLSELRRRKVRSYIVSAIFRRNSVFFRPYGAMWRQALETFDTLFVQNVESKRLLSEIGFDNVVVAGDTRFDRVAQIAAAAQRVETIERFRGGGRLFVAGSTWGPDEEILLPLVNANPDVKFVIAPHEMDEGRIAHLMRDAKGGAVRYTQCDAATRFDDVQVLVLDTMGMLSSVYGSATWAYVGGGFGVGIHNTLEAATFGLPIAFGPNYGKFKEARDMVSLGCAVSVRTAGELAAWFAPLRDDEETLRRASRTARLHRAQPGRYGHHPAQHFQFITNRRGFRRLFPDFFALRAGPPAC